MALIPVEKRRLRLDRFLQNRRKTLEALRGRRLAVGLTTLGFFGASQMLPGLYLHLVALLVLLPIYILFLVRTRREQGFEQKIEDLRDFYAKQSSVDHGLPLKTLELSRFPNPDLARDLDLQELFSYMDASISIQGQSELLKWLCGAPSPEAVKSRQKGLVALSQFPGPLRRLHTLYPKEKIDLDRIQSSADLPLASHPPAWRWAIPVLWLTSIILIAVGSATLGKLVIFLFLGTTLIYLQQTGSSFSRMQSLLTDLEALEPIFLKLKSWQKTPVPGLKILTGPEPHKVLASFKNFVSLMSIQGNPILFYLLNFILPWSLCVRGLAEARRKQLAKSFGPWRKEILTLDTLGSLASLYIYHSKTLAKVETDAPLEAKGLRHPLIPRDQIVDNDFHQKDDKVFLITGSNMSGKSTFLRALGMNYCLAQMGAPVFADSFSAPAAKLMSCIRVSDSLRDGQSYFYAEVRRLKTILEAAKAQPLIFLIDEPLRGTNNRERLDGNRQYLRSLVNTGAIGFLSTHDLEMTLLSKDIPSLVNYHFTDTWKEETLYFDYKIRKGPSTTTNALKIMAQEGLLEL